MTSETSKCLWQNSTIAYSLHASHFVVLYSLVEAKFFACWHPICEFCTEANGSSAAQGYRMHGSIIHWQFALLQRRINHFVWRYLACVTVGHSETLPFACSDAKFWCGYVCVYCTVHSMRSLLRLLAAFPILYVCLRVSRSQLCERRGLPWAYCSDVRRSLFKSWPIAAVAGAGGWRQRRCGR